MAIPNVTTPWPATPTTEAERKRAHAQAVAETGRKEAELERLRERDERGELTSGEATRMAQLTGEDENPQDGGDRPGPGNRRHPANDEESELLKREADIAESMVELDELAEGELSPAKRERVEALRKRMAATHLRRNSGGFTSYAEGQAARVA